MKIIIRTERICSHCGRRFTGALRARYCSNACRQAAYRDRAKRVTP